MSKYPSADKGPNGNLMRVQQAIIAVQPKIIAAGDQITKTLENIASTTPGIMEKLPAQGLLMWSFMELDERAMAVV
jgi:hypothetical protein